MKKKIFVLMIALIVIIGVASSSYAYLKAENESDNNANLALSNFGVILLTDMSNITIDNLYPMLDIDGLKNDSTTFQIQNTGELVANYKVSLIDSEVASTMSNSDVRYQLKKTSSVTGETETLDIANLSGSGLIDEGTIEVNEIITYEIVMWIDYDANPNNLSFSKVVLVEGMQSSNLDQSGANYPELLDNMIPVYYDKTSDTEGVWRVADSRNLNEDYKWFDYNDYMWANAVTVRENSSLTSLTLNGGLVMTCTGEGGVCTRNDYLNAPVGTVIPMEDITTMWVWIPRYKYTIFNGNNENVSEQLIQVAFEHGTSKTGTVTCTDNITTSSSSSSSQTCTDETNGSIVNGKSTYTHPAFTFGDEELTGLWMAKFEMSTDDTITGCTSSSVTSSCNVADINVLVKPDVLSLRYQTASNQFAAIRKMEVYDNIHGFTQSDSATSYLDENGYLTGDIKNDNNSYDIHMLKNLEWGAVTYLSQSVYGKWSNSLYSGDYRRVYKNNYYTSTNYVYKTGYSGGTYNKSYSTSSSSTYLYNDMTSAGTGQGYKGSGASTTGTIYGVFDMNGGAYDLVMGNMINSSGYFYPGSAGTWSTAASGNIPNAKYYDKYSYASSGYSLASQSRGKLGDATREMTQTFGSSSGGWGGSYRYMPYSSSSRYWFLRGGYASSNSYNLLYLSYYSNAASSNANSTRPVLIIPRDMPWLNE